jgi:phosphoglycolate phosphatase-like HAD superfamily hydrolase
MNRKIILWDLDGTLIQVNRFGSDKHAKSVEQVTGLPARGISSSRGKTDRQVITEYLDQIPSPRKTGDIDLSLEILDVLTTKELEITSVFPTKGASLAVRAAHNIGWENLILTGNTPHRARIKLYSAGFRNEFSESVGFFGHLHTSRFELVRSAVENIRQSVQSHIVIIGDTPLDIESAHRCGVPVVAIATGDFSYQDLQMHSPDLLIQDLDVGLLNLVEFLDAFSFIS